ncbi:MAG: OmpL47-type beta-barrel domain-containing protein [Thermoplasmatota archaeon]
MKTTVSIAAMLVLAALASPLAVQADGDGGASVPVWYEEVAAEVGLTFQNAGEVSQHTEFFSPWPAFPEIMGSGACWLDYDQDGYEDLYLVSQRFNPENAFSVEHNQQFDPRNELYRNRGDGTFEDVSTASGADSDGFGYACSAADFDDDGDLDLFVANYGDDELLRNNGDGTFTDVTHAAGINEHAGCGDHPCMSIASAWADYDLDGDLDLFVGNYLDVSLTNTTRGPEHHVSQLNFLWRNEGDGSFTEQAAAAGVAGRAEKTQQGSKTLGAVWFDAELDGDLDLYVANDLAENEFYVNNGDGTFADHSHLAGLADTGTSMGVTTGDYDQDGYPDLFFTHYSYQDHGFYRNLGDGTFEKRSGEDEQANTDGLVGWGTHFVDLDRDGDLDLHAAFGHTEPHLDDYSQPSKFYYNEPGDGSTGDRFWADLTDVSGPGAAALGVTRGSAYADYDLDGDTDIIQVNNGNQTAQLLRADGHGNHWLSILLKQPAPNIHAIGSRVVVESGGLTQVLELQAGSSYESQNSQRLDFGLGDALVADKITVHWPGGGITQVLDVAADQAVRIDRTLGLVTDTLSPWTTPILNGVEEGAPWQTDPITLVLDTVDRNVGAPAGVELVEYRVDGGPWQTYDGPLQFTETGTYHIECRSIDKAGNKEPVRGLTIVIDSVAPAIVSELAGVQGNAGWWTSPDVEVELAATDDLSGLDTLEYRVGDGAWTPYEGAFTISGSAIHEVTARATDRAGNVATTTLTIPIDAQAPAASIDEPAKATLYAAGNAVPLAPGMNAVIVAPEGPFEDGRFTVHATSIDSGSGAAEVRFLVDGILRATVNEAPYTWDWPVADDGLGQHKLRIEATDVAGNVRAKTVNVQVVA